MRPDEATLREYVVEIIGDRPDEWPGGWPHEIEAALIDAVFSVRAKYGSRSRGTGVYGAVQRWRAHRRAQSQGRADNLVVLAATSEPDLVAITNRGKLAGRTKAQVVIDAAAALMAVQVVTAQDFAEREDQARRAYLSVRGCGPVTWAYFRMLLGHDDVKADTWIRRFVQDKLPSVKSSDEASRLVHAVAADLGVEAKQLDHAIWAYRRTTSSS